MKKKIVTLAVAAAMVAPLAAFAETTLYGRLDTSLNYDNPDETATINQDGTISAVDEDDDSVWDVGTNTTRVGIKGSEDLGNGLKAIFQAEWAFSSSEGGSTADGLRNRLAYAGLSGGWGTMAIGRQWTPYYGAVDKTDIFNRAADDYYLGSYRTGNALQYISPSFGGFQVKGIAVLDGDNDAKDGIDVWQLTGEYNNGPISIGAGYSKAYGGSVPAGALIPPAPGTPYPAGAQDDDTETWGLGGSWNFGMFKLIGQYEQSKLPDIADRRDQMKWKSWAVGGEGYFGNNTIRAVFGNLDYDYDDDNTWVVGYQYNFSKRTRTYVEYGDRTGVSRNNVSEITAGSAKTLALGFRHDF